MSSSAEIVDGHGQRLRLGTLLGRGGEGSVFELPASPDLVAKIYHSALSAERAEKIRTMIALRNDRISRLTAWPADLLSIASSRAPVGLIMPKVSGRKDIHHLYSPKSRRVDFQRADWRFLIRASANTARAFAVVHETGCIIGDVNHGGVLVAQDATVRLIDCDSFQVINGSRRFLCEVGVETFTPPELQGKPFKGVIRNENHDNFGLAVLIFLMLFMGRHPFAGKYLGPDQMPIPRAIKECRFAYGVRRAAQQMVQPPGTPTLSIVGDEVAFLFERAFAKEMIPGGRPTSRDWIDSLGRLESTLKQCSANPSHWHRTDTSCPWCPMERATGVPLFPIVAQIAGSAVNIDALWTQVEAIPHPGPPPSFGTPTVQRSEAAKLTRSANRKRLVTATVVTAVMIASAAFAGLPSALLVGGIVGFLALTWLLGKTDVVRNFKVARDRSLGEWTTLQQQWQEQTSVQPYERKKCELQAIRQALSEIPKLRLQKLDQLHQNQRAIQFAAFLDQHKIQDAKIAGIGPGRKQTLQSYGIETAADVNLAAITAVPGFGQLLADNLIAWRRSVEKKFHFDPAKAIDPSETTRVEQEVLLERQRLEGRLRTGFAELKQVHAQILAARQHMMPLVAAAHMAYLQADADFKAASRL